MFKVDAQDGDEVMQAALFHIPVPIDVGFSEIELRIAQYFAQRRSRSNHPPRRGFTFAKGFLATIGKGDREATLRDIAFKQTSFQTHLRVVTEGTQMQERDHTLKMIPIISL